MKKNCVFCGNEFNTWVSRPAKFCSRQCWKKFHKEKYKKRICEICGKVFYRTLSNITYGIYGKMGRRGRFCSKKCQCKGTSLCFSGKNSHFWRGGKVKVVCSFCKKILFVSKCRKNKFRFCSSVCMTKWKSENWKGNKSPLWKKRIKKYCLTCKKIFYIKQWHKKMNRGKFCSSTCAGVWSTKHMLKKNTSIELKVEEYLNKLGINFESQKVIPEGRTVADFYIPEQRLVIYADGFYWHNFPKVKKRDKKQNILLSSNGYNVLRLKEKEINSEPSKCIQTIKNYIN